MKFSKVVDLEDFSSPDLITYLREIASRQMPFMPIAERQVVPDAENWRMAMGLYSLDSRNLLQSGKLIANFRHDLDPFPFFLANKGPIVFDVCSDSSDASIPGSLIYKNHVANSFLLEKEVCSSNIIPLRCNNSAVSLPSSFIDAIVCGSLRHFESYSDLSAFLAEVGRVLKPGGLVSLAVDYVLDMPENGSTSKSYCSFLDKDQIEKWIVKSSGLESVGSIDRGPSPVTYANRKNVFGYLSTSMSANPRADVDQPFPSLILNSNGTLYCPAHILLSKSKDWTPSESARIRSEHVRHQAHRHSLKYKNSDVPSYRSPKLASPPIGVASGFFALIFGVFKVVDSALIRLPALRNWIKKIVFRDTSLCNYLNRTFIFYNQVYPTFGIGRGLKLFFMGIIRTVDSALLSQPFLRRWIKKIAFKVPGLRLFFIRNFRR